MSRPYKSFVRVYAPVNVSGWAVYRCRVDDYFEIYVNFTHLFLDGSCSYPYELFIDYMAELPAWCFTCWEQAQGFAQRHSNRYPIDRQMQLLRFRDQYWIGTVLNAYYSVIEMSKATVDDTENVKV